MDEDMVARIKQLSAESDAFEKQTDGAWNHVWLIQARQVVLLERIEKLLQARTEQG